MSQLKVNALVSYSGNTVTLGTSGDTINVASGVTFNTASATVNYPAGSITNAAISSTAAIQQSKILGSPGFRNIVINGAMSIAQRSTSVASITTQNYFTVDRFETAVIGLGTWTNSQSTDTPTGQGFATSFKLDCTTADASPAAGDVLLVQQRFEGQNLQYLKKGTANAVPLTASFWVKSTKTGTFICELEDLNNARQVSAAYTVNVTNTWEKKTITFPADTTGAFTNNNGGSLSLLFWLGAGSTYSSGTLNTTWASLVQANRAVGQVNIADSTSNDWYITGVQLEAGTSASDFESLPVDVNLGRCERYCRVYGPNTTLCTALSFGTTTTSGTMMFGNTMRASPTITASSTTLFQTTNGSGAGITSTNFSVFSTTVHSTEIQITVASGLTVGQAAVNRTGAGSLTISAEL